MKKTVFEGMATAIITPITENGIDYDAFGKLIDWQIEQGIDAIVVCGTTGEASTMTDDEHRDAIAFAVIHANKRVPINRIEEFMREKSEFILRALDKFASMPKKEKVQYFGDEEIKAVILDICKKIYPSFEKRGIKYPIIKFRKMTSRWGSCNYVKGIITFNTSLKYAPYECIEYVAYHEFCHFLQANHSPLFYKELEAVCPKHRECRKVMKNIQIR